MTLFVDIDTRLGTFDLKVAFEGPAAAATALFGPSGAGKTSVLAAVAGLTRPKSGRIALGDRVLFDSRAGIDLPAHRRGVGVVFQDARLFPHLTVAGNIAFGAKRAAAPLPPAEREALIDLLAIRPLLQRRPAALSGGERQRVSLARALAAGPALLALDEPLAALDAPRKSEILPYLEAVRDRSGIPMLYVSHAVEEVARLADRLVLLDRGRVVEAGPTGALLSRPDLVDRFGQAHAGAVFTARAVGTEAGLTRLEVGGQSLWAEVPGAPAGAAVRLHIRALDVTLSLDPPGRVSANTVLAGRIARMVEGPAAYVDVAVALVGPTGGDPGDPDPLSPQTPRLLARVTRRSADRLALEEGQPVYCLIKAVTIHHAPVG